MSEPTRVGQGLWEAQKVRILGRDHEEACAKVHSPHRDGLLPPSLVEDVVSLGAQWQGEGKLESAGSCECRSWAAFWHTDLQIEVTDAFLPLSKFRVNSSFAPLTRKQPAKRILGNVVQINPVVTDTNPRSCVCLCGSLDDVRRCYGECKMHSAHSPHLWGGPHFKGEMQRPIQQHEMAFHKGPEKNAPDKNWERQEKGLRKNDFHIGFVSYFLLPPFS